MEGRGERRLRPFSSVNWVSSHVAPQKLCYVQVDGVGGPGVGGGRVPFLAEINNIFSYEGAAFVLELNSRLACGTTRGKEKGGGEGGCAEGR